MTIPNIHPVSGIHYGVINANNIDSEVLDKLSFFGGIDVNYLELRVDYAKREYDFVMPEKGENESVYDFATRVESAVDELCFGDTLDVDEDFTGHIWYGKYEDVHTIYDTDTNTVTVLESPVIVLANPCSPCYPNAGDLDTLTEDGIETYGIPEDWKPEY